MLTTPHVLVGLYLASHLPPVLALPLALLAHFLFDYFYPHWNPHLYTEKKSAGKLSKNTLHIILVDGFLALIVTTYIIWQKGNPLLYITAMILSVLPDLLEIPYYFFNTKNKFIRKIVNFEHLYQAKANFIWGSLSQILVIIVCLWAIL